MTIVVILLTLGTVGVRTTLAKARDDERAKDVAALAQAIERRYNNGNTLFVGSNATNQSMLEPGKYPSNAEVIYGCNFVKNEFTPNQTTLPNCDALLQAWHISKSLITLPSGNTWFDVVCWFACSPAETQTQTENALKSGGNWVDKYIYEAITSSGNICYTGTVEPCVRFNLYWRSEVDGTIHQVRSIHQ